MKTDEMFCNEDVNFSCHPQSFLIYLLLTLRILPVTTATALPPPSPIKKKQIKYGNLSVHTKVLKVFYH